jgi:hypothetical protein
MTVLKNRYEKTYILLIFLDFFGNLIIFIYSLLTFSVFYKSMGLVFNEKNNINISPANYFSLKCIFRGK